MELKLGSVRELLAYAEANGIALPPMLIQAPSALQHALYTSGAAGATANKDLDSSAAGVQTAIIDVSAHSKVTLQIVIAGGTTVDIQGRVSSSAPWTTRTAGIAATTMYDFENYGCSDLQIVATVPGGGSIVVWSAGRV